MTLSQPVALSRYAELPKIEKSQGKGKVQKYVGKDVSLLGYGVQAFVPYPVSDLTRTIAQEELSQPIPVAADKFVQIDQQAAGFCLGDSGGPVLEKKKDVVLAINAGPNSHALDVFRCRARVPPRFRGGTGLHPAPSAKRPTAAVRGIDRTAPGAGIRCSHASE